MRLVIPVSKIDYELAEFLACRLISFGTLKDVGILVIIDKATEDITERAVSLLERVGDNVHVMRVPLPPEMDKWPDASNYMFHTAAEHLHAVQNDQPFYWFEADCFPIDPYFLTKLTKTYRRAARSFMGVIWPTRYDQPDGSQLEKGRHMVGAGIYPADFMRRCHAIHTIPENMAFDVWIQQEVVYNCYPTPLMFHGWNTGRYAIKDGKLIGEDLGDRTNKALNGGRVVPKETVTIHGCKDQSLYDIDFSQW